MNMIEHNPNDWSETINIKKRLFCQNNDLKARRHDAIAAVKAKSRSQFQI